MAEKFDVLILSGGGIKGIGPLGVLQYYYEQKMFDLEHIKEYAATSIGSAISLLLVCGYPPMDIFTKVYTLKNFFKVTDIQNIWKIFENYGIMAITPFIEIIEDLVKQKLGKLPTLRELYDMTGKILTIPVVNESKRRVEYFNYETRPNLGAVDAVKLSCNLPVIFRRIKYDGDYWVDGGLVDNFPYDAVKNKSGKILGIVVTGTDKEDSKDTFINYIYRLIIIPINTMTHLRTKNLSKNVTLITMNFDNVPIINFAMDSEKKMDMFMKGYHDAQREQEKEIIMVPGWKWDEDPPLDFIAWDTPPKSSDGWDDDWDINAFDKK